MSSLYANLVRGEDGAWSTAYGPFVIRTALQPVFRRLAGGILDVEAFQGLARAELKGESCPPSQFFPLVDRQDLPVVDSQLRAIHILNAGLLKRRRSKVFVSFTPDHYAEGDRLRHEVEHLRLSANEAGLGPDRIVCDISLDGARSRPALTASIAALRDAGFRIAVSDYGAGDESLEGARLLKPDYVKFDGHWVRDYMSNPAGLALLKVIVRRFMEDAIEPLFERLEEMWQVDLCEEVGVPLMLGYALARPELAPTGFDRRFPEMLVPPQAPLPVPQTEDERVSPPFREAPKAARAFGRRGV